MSIYIVGDSQVTPLMLAAICHFDIIIATMPPEAHLSTCLDRLLCDKKAAADTTVREDCNKITRARNARTSVNGWCVFLSLPTGSVKFLSFKCQVRLL